jgi:hypothetical protein
MCWDLLKLIIRPSVWMFSFPGHEGRQAKTHPARLANPSEETKNLADRVRTIAKTMLQLETGRKELLTFGVKNGSLQKGFLPPKGELGRSC